MMASLDELLEKSRHLATHIQGNLSNVDSDYNALPPIERNLDQIQQLSQRLAVKNASDDTSVHSKALQMLSQHGIDTNKLTKSLLNLDVRPSVVDAAQPVIDTDVVSYLRNAREQLILSVVESTLARSKNDFHQQLEDNARSNWKNMKKSLIEQMSAPVSQFSANVNGVSAVISDVALSSYAPVVQQLLEAHISHDLYPVISSLEKVVSGLSPNNTPLLECFRILKSLMKEDPEGGHQPSLLAYRTMYQQPQTEDQPLLREQFVGQSKRYLEQQFIGFIEKTILQHPREAQLGGRPGIDDKVRAFLNIKYYRAASGGWTLGQQQPQQQNPQSLEIVADRPFWAHLYYLMRCGGYEAAYSHARHIEPFLDHSDRHIVSYLKAYIDADDARLPHAMRSQLLAEYNQRVKTSRDPYKLAIYKLVGRCELHKKTIPYVLQATEDYLWLQLMLTRERYSSDEAAYEKYALKDLQRILVAFGADHFNHQRSHPFNYVHVLLLSAQFERAVAFLYDHQYPAEAVHLGIALLAYGTLRVAPKKTAGTRLLVESAEEDADQKRTVVSLSVDRLLYQYIVMVMKADPLNAIHYIYAMCFLESPSDDIQPLLIQVILESRDYGALLGELQPDGTRTRGWIERYSVLHPSVSISILMRSCAEACESTSRLDDAMQLYNLMGAYDSVLGILHRRVSERFTLRSDRVAFRQIWTLLQTIFSYYSQRPLLKEKISGDLWKVTEELIQLCDIFNAYDDGGDYEKVLTLAENMRHWIPQNNEMVEMQRCVERYQQFAEVITRHMSELFVIYMTSVYKVFSQLKESVYLDAARSAKLNELKKQGRALVTFIGMIPLKMPQDMYARITRMDVYMN